ncbi:hypothetical protein OAN307_c37140 [Octadecabacter antarcticus 307]|uniref:Uncharacterized protein n=1 Tax=Octadecabacter antarcticus 307 TaxID=391626 RepID=M9RBN1_9RHOB|nr:hypothetical protein OAN307_c37140 [Octadecabacter antarcticus 307]
MKGSKLHAKAMGMSLDHANKYADDVRNLIEQRLRIKGRTLDKTFVRAGRLLPKWAHREGHYLAQAAQHMGHPKLRPMIDEDRLKRAHNTLVAHLKTIDPVERRKTRILGVLGVVSFNLILVAAALLIFLMWRGYL